MPFVRFFSLLVLVLTFAAAAADEPKRAITHEDLWLMPRVGGPTVSPDGRLAVVSVHHPAYDEDDAESNLWLLHTDNSKPPRQLTFSTGGEAHVAWRPDSRAIAFSARRNGDDPPQIHVLDLAAGGEARPVTFLSTGAQRPVFAPDGERIAFTSSVHPDAMDDADSQRIQEEEDARDHHVLTYTGFPIRNWNTWLGERQPRLFVQTIGQSEAVDVLAGSDLVARPGYDGVRSAGSSQLQPVWAPDGESLIFVASHNRDRFAFDRTHTDLWRVPAGGGEPERLTGEDSPEGADSWAHPSFSPDGNTLFALRTPRSEYVFNATRLAAMNWPEMSDEREIVLPETRTAGGYAISPDGSEAFLLGQDAGRVRIFRGDTAGGEARPAFEQEAGVYGGLSISADADQSPVLLASYQKANRFAEVVRVELDEGGHEALTDFTAEGMAELDLAPVEHFWFVSEAGRSIHNMLVRPAGFDPDKQYSLLVLMHGGPHTMWTDSPHLRWNYHLLAGNDHVVLLTNYKGSTGFGQDFARAIQNDPLRGPAEEINQAADVAIERFVFIDGDRQCAGGASYGGHLANWMQGSTDRYRCLISHAGLVNLITQWGTSDAVYHRELNLGGPPWEIPEVWLDQNPLMYADQWQTPALVTIGKKDERVPLANVLEYWTALQRQQVESRLLVYPDEDHWIMSGPNSRHFYGEVAEWLERWLGDQEESM
ncbi:MAG: S9 family peptidase [Wenzhouxiangella sp.]|nr:MAG: S9 family peptidase [Wenzhouxiangella sp.]